MLGFCALFRSEDKKLTLLSSSMDKTIIVWTADSELGGIWIESARVGEVGGNTLGFMGCHYDEDAEQILGYSFTGSFHYWAYIMPKWEPSATMGGHFGSVEDLDWDPKGRYEQLILIPKFFIIHQTSYLS